MDSILCIGIDTLDWWWIGSPFPIGKVPEDLVFCILTYPIGQWLEILYFLFFIKSKIICFLLNFDWKYALLSFYIFFLLFFVWIVFLVNVQCVVAVAGECISIIMEWIFDMMRRIWQSCTRFSLSFLSLCSEHALICVIWLFRLSQRITGQMNGLYGNQPATATRSICVCLNIK